MIRAQILDMFLRDAAPPSLEKIALELGLETSEVLQRMAVEPLLEDTPEMELNQALAIERAYSPPGIFSPSLVELLSQDEQARARFEKFRKRAKALKPKDEPL